MSQEQKERSSTPAPLAHVPPVSAIGGCVVWVKAAAGAGVRALARGTQIQGRLSAGGQQGGSGEEGARRPIVGRHSPHAVRYGSSPFRLQ